MYTKNIIQTICKSKCNLNSFAEKFAYICVKYNNDNNIHREEKTRTRNFSPLVRSEMENVLSHHRHSMQKASQNFLMDDYTVLAEAKRPSIIKSVVHVYCPCTVLSTHRTMHI